MPLLNLICSQQLIRLILHLCPAQCTHTWLLQLLSAGELVLWRRARTALADEPGLRKTVCVCGGNVRVAEGIDSLPSSAPFLSLHPVVGDGSLKRGARDHLRVCVFVGFLCVNNFSFAVFAVSPPTWSHCKYFPDRLWSIYMCVVHVGKRRALTSPHISFPSLARHNAYF